MSYTKKDVYESYFENGIIDRHKKNTIEIVKALLIEKGEFHIDDFHRRISESRNVPLTSKYTSLLTVMVEENFLQKNKKTKTYTATNLLKIFIGIL